MTRKITPENAAVCKRALAALARIDPDGMTRESLMDIASMSGGRPLTTAEQAEAFFELRDREWIAPHTNPITGMETWSITVNGQNALPAL